MERLVPYCNEFCLARLGMQFTININCRNGKKEREIYLKNRKETIFYGYILVHDFCKSLPDIHIKFYIYYRP